MLTLTRRLSPTPSADIAHTLALSAEERTRSRFRFQTEQGLAVQLLLPRGTVLRDGDVLGTDDSRELVRVQARAEPVMTAHTKDAWTLLRAAYHLGNRHVPVEIGKHYLRFAPDPVLANLLHQLGLIVIEDVAAFAPEAGAYGGHAHDHPRTVDVPYRIHP